MQASAIDTVTKLIQSPPRTLVACGVLFGAVWGVLKGAESIMTDDTKLVLAYAAAHQRDDVMGLARVPIGRPAPGG